jgi:hypothetical protein
MFHVLYALIDERVFFVYFSMIKMLTSIRRANEVKGILVCLGSLEAYKVILGVILEIILCSIHT